MENLPRDILENILSLLAIKEALHAKRVCTTWRAILRYKTAKPGIFFAFSHVERWDHTCREEFFYEDEYDHYDNAKINHYYSYDTLTKIEHGKFITEFSPRDIMVGSCNGLICFGKKSKDALGTVPFLICNPLTGESVFLPGYNYSELPRDIPRQRFPYRLAGGFGYCSSTDKYKVVTMYYHPQESKGHVQVYTVGGEWRYIGYMERYNRYTFGYCPGIHANGTLYWLHESYRMVQESEIVSFNMEHEKLRRISTPRSKYFAHKTDISPLKLLGWNNKLYFVYANYKASRTEIWVYKTNNINGGTNYANKECNLKKNYQCRSSLRWSKEFKIRWEASKPKFTPFAITRNNQILLWYDHHVPFQTRLYCYDPKTSTLNVLWDDDKSKGMKCWKIEAIPHRQSIVSLRKLGEKNVTSLKDCDKLMLEEKPASARAAKRSKKC